MDWILFILYIAWMLFTIVCSSCHGKILFLIQDISKRIDVYAVNVFQAMKFRFVNHNSTADTKEHNNLLLAFFFNAASVEYVIQV